MATWNSRGLRGSTLEDMINHTNEYYRQKKSRTGSEDTHPYNTNKD